MRSASLALAAALPMLSSVSGCAELNRTAYHRAAEGPEARVIPGYLSYSYPSAGTGISIEGADLDLTVHSTRMTVSLLFMLLIVPFPALPAYCETPSMEICIEVKPKAAGLAFDPAQVTIHSRDGSFQPSAVQKMSGCPACPASSTSPALSVPPGGSPLERGEAVPIAEGTAFGLRFPARPLSPDVPFLLELNGFRLGDRAVAVPPIQFVEGRKWSCHLLPLFR